MRVAKKLLYNAHKLLGKEVTNLLEKEKWEKVENIIIIYETP